MIFDAQQIEPDENFIANRNQIESIIQRVLKTDEVVKNVTTFHGFNL